MTRTETVDRLRACGVREQTIQQVDAVLGDGESLRYAKRQQRQEQNWMRMPVAGINFDHMHMGDLLFNRAHPNIDRAQGARIDNWITILETVAKRASSDTIFIAGHAKDNAVSNTRAEMMHFRNYLTAVLDHVQKGIAAGKSVEEISKVAQVPGFPQHEGAPTGTLQMTYEELLDGHFITSRYWMDNAHLLREFLKMLRTR